MSYQVIARKWRPQAFDEVVGQDHVTTALRNAIRTDRMPHALLLTGPRGVGKTTLARIVARSLNCEKGPTDTPCGSCSFCEEISAGRSTDVQEIDAASRTGVDDIREVIESIRYAPSPGKHRIFVIDEVHMLSTPAFNALLKTLEEPPPQSIFIFATTNPEKIPFTVISRCQRYDLRRIQVADVAGQLGTIAESEGIEVSKASLNAIAREGDGSMRDAQTLLDQLIAYGGEKISDETVAEVLDLIDRRVLLAIGSACVDGDAATALEACERAASGGSDPKRLAAALLQLLRDLVVMAVAPKAKGLVEGNDAELDELRELAGRCEPARLRRMFRALVKDQEDLAWAPQPYAVLEMAVVRLATLPAGDDVARLLGRLDALEKQLRGGGGGPGGGGGSAGRGVAASPSKPGGGARGGGARSRSDSASTADATSAAPDSPSASAEDASRPTEVSEDARGGASTGPAAAAVSTEPSPSDPPPTIAASPPASPASAEAPTATSADAPTADAPLDVVFDRLRAFAQDEDRGGFASLEGGRLLARTASGLRIEARNAFHAKRLRDRSTELEALCTRFFGKAMTVELADPGRPDPSRPPPPDGLSEGATRREEARRLRQAALQHPAVNTALEVLEASIVDIRPLGGGEAPR